MECFADKVYDIYKPGDIILVYDYHLMMLPHLLRQRLPDAYLVFSLHTSRRTAAVPWPLEEVLEGILGSNTIISQTFEDRMDFIAWCAKKLADQSLLWATRAMDSCTVLPMGIDLSSLVSVAQSQAVDQKCESLRRTFKDTKIVLSYSTPDTGAERKDVATGFNRMLAQMPLWKGGAILLQIICTSRARDSLGECSTSLFDEVIGSISVEYGSSEFQHVLHYRGQVSELEFHALLRISDAAIFPLTPGGPMTAALEYYVCRPRDNKRPIVSDLNPVAHQIPEPITYRQGDIDSIAKAIDYALLLSDRSPMRKLHLEEHHLGFLNTAESWTNTVLHDLTEDLLNERMLANTTDACGSRLPGELTAVYDGNDELSGGDGSVAIGDDGDERGHGEGNYDKGDRNGSYYDEEGYEGDYERDCDEGNYDERDYDEQDYAKSEKGGKGANDGGDDGREEEDSLEGDAGLEGSDGEETAVEADEEADESLVTRSVDLEEMASLREAWARKAPATV